MRGLAHSAQAKSGRVRKPFLTSRCGAFLPFRGDAYRRRCAGTGSSS
jgi:hypothetical protein